MHERHFLREIYSQLVARQRYGCAFDVYVHGNFSNLVIFYIDQQIIPKTAAGVIEHRD